MKVFRHSNKLPLAFGTIRLLFILLLTAMFPQPAWPQQDALLEHLEQKAGQLKLHEEREWTVLLHYRKTWSGGYVSRIDDPKFFLSPTGRTDPEAELRRTLRAFFTPSPEEGMHASCRFPARFDWLIARLGIDTSQLPLFSCSERDKILSDVEGNSAVMVFPVGHINSPASMFGHTLLRFDGEGKSSLVSFAANYAAATTDTNGFIYAYRGLFGRYKGYYSLLPYYLKVKEYSDLEHRDMWEYRLKLSPEEVRKMLNHLWELQNIHSPYYFLDENCSFNLLYLIEAARPDLHLTDRTGILVLPTDTIRILRESGLLEEARYRPSQGSRIRRMLSLLGPEKQQAAFDLSRPGQSMEIIHNMDLPDRERMAILDLAAEYVQMKFARKELEKEEYTKHYLKLLEERSSLGKLPEGLYNVEEPSRPEEGHETSRLAVGGGVRRGRPFGEVEVQPEFHGLLDPDRGYLKGAQIKFLDTAVRYYFSDEKFELKRLHILDILSLSPRNIFFRPLSWKVNTGLDTEPLREGRDRLIYRLNTGGGYSYSSPWNGIWYAMAEVDVNAGEGIRGGITAGPGIGIGGLEQLTEWWKAHLSARGFIYKVGDDRWSLKLSLAQSLSFGRNDSLNILLGQEIVNNHSIFEAGMLWNHYF